MQKLLTRAETAYGFCGVCRYMTPLSSYVVLWAELTTQVAK